MTARTYVAKTELDERLPEGQEQKVIESGIDTFFFGVCSISVSPSSLLFLCYRVFYFHFSLPQPSFMSGKNLKMHQLRDFISVWEYIKIYLIFNINFE